MSGKQRTIALPSVADLVRAFNLTQTEAEVTLDLATGKSAADIAAARAASVHTIRTHLKRALVKTGTHTQAALVGKVYRAE